MDFRLRDGHNDTKLAPPFPERTVAMSTDTTRRDFLKTSATVIGGGAVAVDLSLLANVHAQGNDTIRVGLVGCGGRGSGAVEQCLRADNNVRLTAVGDTFRAKATSLLTRL